MRANGPRAPIKFLPLHQYEGLCVLRYILLAPQKLGGADQNFWYCKTDHILNSRHNNSVHGLIENITFEMSSAVVLRGIELMTT